MDTYAEISDQISLALNTNLNIRGIRCLDLAAMVQEALGRSNVLTLTEIFMKLEEMHDKAKVTHFWRDVSMTQT